MRKKALATVTAGLMFLAPTFAAPAEARGGWSIGTSFSVGPVVFSLVFGAHGRYRPGYFWRTSEPISYRGLRCSERCFADHGHTYHHEACPVLLHHLRVHRSFAAELFDGYAPRPIWEGRHYDVTSPYGDEGSWRDRRDHRYEDSRRSDRRHGRRSRHHSSREHGQRYRSYSP